MVKPCCSNVRMITANFPGVQIFRTFTVFLVVLKPYKNIQYRNDPKFSDRQAWANSVDPDQRGAVCSGSTLFAIPSASGRATWFKFWDNYSNVWMSKDLGILWYQLSV